MPVRELKASPILAVERFKSFEEFRPNDVIGGGTSIPLDPKSVVVARAALALPFSRLVMQRSFARRLEADMGAPGAALIIPMSRNAYAEINERAITSSVIALFRGTVPTRTLEPNANTCVMLRFHSDMQNRGWMDFEKGFDLLPTDVCKMRRVQSVLLDIFSLASDCTDGKHFAVAGEAMEESLLAALDAVLLSPQTMRPSPGSYERHRKLVARLDELANSAPTTPLYVTNLAHELGVSVRSLQAAVHAVRGIGTHRYITLKRLWLTRQKFSSASPGCTVRDVALSNGFWHMGEFSQAYKAAFGEPPSQTLQRNRVELSLR